MASVSMVAEQQLAKLYFVLPKDHTTFEDASADMQMAYTTAREHIDDKDLQQWITEADCQKLNQSDLSKKHVYVFEKFSGAAFERAKKSRSTVIGPRCLISCFMDNEAIPLGVQPVFTTAMRNLTVCSSGLKAKVKAHVSQLVFYMGGYYMDVLSTSCTHLVTCTVKSVKYEKAAERKVIILGPDWVQDVWEVSQQRSVHGSDVQFLERHRLPVFHSLTISSTGLTVARRNEIKQLIESNGGHYVGAFKPEVTDILLLDKTGTGSAKFQAAVCFKKECLTPDWILDSVTHGYALPIKEYEVRSLKASTPTKADNNPGPGRVSSVTSRDFNPDCTELSEISHVNVSSRNMTINESIMSVGGDKGTPTVATAPRSVAHHRYRELLARMTVQQAKKAGPVLDGCSVYLSGFTGDEKEKLNKILNAVGAVRYDDHSPSVSHVIVGEQLASEMGQLRDASAQLLTLEWLAKSIELRQTLGPEEAAEYTFRPSGRGVPGIERAPEPPSPSSKRNLERLHSGVFKRPDIPKFRLDDCATPPTVHKQASATAAPANVPPAPSDQQSIVMQYLEKNLAERLPPSSEKEASRSTSSGAAGSRSGTTDSQADSELESQDTEFMLGKTLFVFGFSEEDAVQILTDCKYCGGTIVDESYGDEVDYIVLPTSCTGTVDFAVRGKQTVNDIWLEASIQDGVCYPLEYYFAPIVLEEDDPRPLEGETIVISSYTGPERSFLSVMGGVLGATVHERLLRKAAPLLVCKEASGDKYKAAIQWGLTVVTAEWLLECFRQKRRIAETPYLVGESTCSSKNEGPIPCHVLPTTSTDEVDIDSVHGEGLAEESRKTPKTKPLPKPTAEGGDYRYIQELKAKEASDLQYGFKHVTTPEMRKMTSDERMIYSQELDQYDDLIAAQRAQRKPFDPNEGAPSAAGGQAVAESPAVPRNKRLSALTVGGPKMSSPATPGGRVATSTSSSATSGSGTPLAMDYEALSVTQRVLEFDTPIRDVLYRALKESEENERKLSPRTRRMKELLATPNVGGGGPGSSNANLRTPTLPECMTKPVTPYGFRPDASPENHAFHKRKLQYWDRFYKPPANVGTPEAAAASSSRPDRGDTGEPESPAQNAGRRLSTPLSEIKRKFWRDNLGDDYVKHIEAKYNTQYQRPDLNRSDEEIACTAPQGKDPSPDGSSGRKQHKNIAGAVDAGAERISPVRGPNVSGEKRSRDDDDHETDDDHSECADDQRLASGDMLPAAKRPHLLEATPDENVRRLSAFITATRESAKKKARHPADTEDHLEQASQGPQPEAYDSEVVAGVGGVIWNDRGIENAQTNHPSRERSSTSGDEETSPIVRRAQLKRSSLSTTDNVGGRPGHHSDRMKHNGTPVFTISNVQNDENRVELAKQIEALNGRLAADVNRYDPTCTHIVCGMPNRGEKILAGIAAGKWLLSTKYLQDSYQKGHFLDEEGYEWGNPKATGTLADLACTGEVQTMAKAAYTWRKRIATDGGKQDGAFTGFRVLLVTPRKEPFVRLLQSGGGLVLDCEPPFIQSEQAMTATHCFVDRKAKLSGEDHRALGEAGIAVLQMMYLSAYLTSEKLPDSATFQFAG
ncbi:DNA topoisomerase 2-binding protein 1 [Anopheles cruzii]|uniref:DNA topoisomerase 2-binding protein 1 n=1 Tax=Anopheles cruzii TaxID=68878 RepID=UPI0022EC1B73|nr:DNA topoisomerase 2-binding protein 1 [Anopheles cruzii]